MERDYCEEAIIQNLKDAGCSEEQIKQFQTCYCQGKEKESLCLLNKHRCELVECMHREQKRIDCLDYLIYKMTKK